MFLVSIKRAPIYRFILSTEGKLTSLEEFRIQKDLFENQIKEAHDNLKKKDEELPVHLERMERRTVLRIETFDDARDICIVR